MYAIPGIVDLEVTLEQDIPEYRLIVDRERAVDVGVNTGQIVRTLGALVGGQAVTTYEDEDGDAVNVRVRLPLALREDVSQVERLRLVGPEAGSGSGCWCPWANWSATNGGPPLRKSTGRTCPGRWSFPPTWTDCPWGRPSRRLRRPRTGLDHGPGLPGHLCR